ncbi:CotS family spore coat protein [Paenibacillus sp. GSMTC-2017]|uniref:CotS family spore coat protein n=1 Tax=Paenibacillus sp. GSMTC-2017 TaxID=2794350 RepID=UPI0018D8E20D|nr:CotS family spore coat protein [Paenibacillus sp. GSMTC-2017]MBH5319739.1 CotS family spore coat protein [Paenibacillus sp. GSMTC-2017]
MDQYQIVPWDNMLEEEAAGINLEQYVPPELEQLAHLVSKSYNMDVKGMTLITSKPDKGGAIWRIETNHGPRSLKVLHRTPQRSLFSVGAQEYVVKNGARVPGIILTKDGKNSVVAGGKLWIVTDWIDTLTPVAKIDLDGAMTLCHGLGEFHQWSKGYVAPPEAGKSSRIFKWEGQYQKIMAKIGWFRHIATAYPETTASSHLLSVLDMFEGQARDIFKRFQESAYQKMIRKGEAHWGLAHQDYGWSNGQMGPDGIWVIDLDGVAYDLPIRDLRKIITSTMVDMGTWDLAWIRGVIDAYHRANPLDQETFELLWIDMAFPNEFYKHVKEVVFEPVTFMNTELDTILDSVVATEANKWEVLRELEKDKSKYAAGDYQEIEEAPSLPYAYRDYARGGGLLAPGQELEEEVEQEQEQEDKKGKKDKKDKKDKKNKKEIQVVVNPDGKATILPGKDEDDDKKSKRKSDKKSKKKELQEQFLIEEILREGLSKGKKGVKGKKKLKKLRKLVQKVKKLQPKSKLNPKKSKKLKKSKKSAVVTPIVRKKKKTEVKTPAATNIPTAIKNPVTVKRPTVGQLFGNNAKKTSSIPVKDQRDNKSKRKRKKKSKIKAYIFNYTNRIPARRRAL